MERIEDRSKALSYIGIEVADALKVIPTPVDYDNEEVEEQQNTEAQVQNIEPSTVNAIEEQNKFINETRVDVKPSLWQRIKNSKFGRAVSYIFKIKIVLDTPALPEGKGE